MVDVRQDLDLCRAVRVLGQADALEVSIHDVGFLAVQRLDGQRHASTSQPVGTDAQKAHELPPGLLAGEPVRDIPRAARAEHDDLAPEPLRAGDGAVHVGAHALPVHFGTGKPHDARHEDVERPHGRPERRQGGERLGHGCVVLEGPQSAGHGEFEVVVTGRQRGDLVRVDAHADGDRLNHVTLLAIPVPMSSAPRGATPLHPRRHAVSGYPVKGTMPWPE